MYSTVSPTIYWAELWGFLWILYIDIQACIDIDIDIYTETRPIGFMGSVLYCMARFSQCVEKKGIVWRKVEQNHDWIKSWQAEEEIPNEDKNKIR